ncbi:MAG: DUF3471 domain-containing protein [Candidatus Aminicenantes bacterium]|nr:DUF3471 domain-containing protein [Candidatus Aminicenantes bacterium]NIM79481.1 DUF3471 domain-containing protein [Candidatus Aminicenantes bacterium]NIN18767.1 DUF3471 domain-containing protein [Candidatus Aminicenantes bacterium]NIN42689.1 DUF3471 domain-containing protein [Candidatus Aminicenantes bacterium]NIN85423.1 DUF3471 domain-containing protein [Candidatus Aminicenantes bacterium]
MIKNTAIIMLIVFCMVNICFAGEPDQESSLPQNIEGIWLGTLISGNQKLRIVFRIKKNPDGSLKAEMDSIDQGATGFPVDEVHFHEGVLKIQILAINSAYEGKFNDKVSAFEGRWSQGALNLPLLLKAVDKAPELPLRYRLEPIKLDHKIYDQYVGKYQYKPEKIFKIIKEGKCLYSQYKKQPWIEMFPLSETKFFFRKYDGDITFIKDDKGNVTEMIYRFRSKKLRAVKIKE